MLWPKNLNKEIKTGIKLADLTSFKIGGRARFFFEPRDLKSLQEALACARKAKVKVFILGAGSNILASDSGIDGMVIKLSGRDFKGLDNKGTCITAGSGLKLNQLILFAKDKGLSGLEFLAGVPGTLGGSLAGNAGAWGKSIGEQVKEVSVLDYNGRQKLLAGRKLKFAYRKSNLNKYIILSAKLKLHPADKERIAFKIKEYLLKRSKTQGSSLPNAGCVFKNPAKSPAGSLIDACGLKGKTKGAALISRVHANFILNLGKAKSGDVLSLMDLMRRKVKERFKINLQPEIKIWR
ncbi:MAG: UDP-N-acetylmuramate dehydrogenase [Candidatus Omnitrophica bacterium]|nr:UDP-N-acetylmuramate dehydrogenase [Candidatus Omnitrophota bacterium]